jgi:hypothetical protein
MTAATNELLASARFPERALPDEIIPPRNLFSHRLA